MKAACVFAGRTSHAGIDMTRIGHWETIAAYYRGGDGNVWQFSGGRFSNLGPVNEFNPKSRRGEFYYDSARFTFK